MDEAQIESIVDELKYFVDINTEGKTDKEIILEHFDEVIEYCDRYLVAEFLVKEAVYDPDYEEYISKNFSRLVSLIPAYDLYKFLGTLTEFSPSVIIENINEIISDENIENFWNIFASVKGKNEDIDRLLNEKLRDGNNYFEKALIFQYLEKQRIENSRGAVVPDFKQNVSTKEKDIYAKTLNYIIRETLDETHTDYTDIRYLDEGVFSQVYQIGDKVLKIGSELHKYRIPNHRRLLQPLIRTNYTLEDGKVFSSFQLFPLGNTYFSSEEKTDDKLYEVYKDCRKDGIILLDIKWKNLCKLLSDNVTTWKGKRVKISPDSVGLEGEAKGSPLKSGNIVYDDLDLIYRENDPDIPWVKMSDECKKLEQRYQNELREIQIKSNGMHGKHSGIDMDDGDDRR